MPSSPKRSRRIRLLLRVAAGVVAFFGAVEILARWNIRREHAQRQHLGNRLFAAVRGERGDPIVFIPGLQGSTRYWGDSFESLAGHHRLIYVDLVGFGQSPWPDIDYTLEDHLGYLRRTLTNLEATENVTIVAHSFGTIVASYYAARHPQEIRRVVLLGTPVYADEEEARDRIWDMAPLAALFSLRPILAREACLLMGSLRPFFKWLLPKVMNDVPDAVAEDAVLHSWPSIHGAIDNILLGQPVIDALRVTGPKTVLVHGTEDTVTSMDRIEATARETGAQVRPVPTDHHGYIHEGRDEIIAAIHAAIQER